MAREKAMPFLYKNNAVTIRHRDTMQQERVKIEDLHKIIGDAVNMKNLFQKII
ncbi:MAG: hypothetical protein LBN95_12295 [Prevotellaceae bacterium]|nr:hypothetical protein [Prevotellaceae bacterium]